MINKITKVLSLVLVAHLLLAGIVTAEDAVVESDSISIENEEAYKVIEMLGILPDSVKEKASADANVTRAELAGILYNIATFTHGETESAESWETEFFGDYTMEVTAEVAAEKTAFYDVDTSMDFGMEISYICSRGIMNGKGNGIFAPEQNVSYMEVAKTLVGMLGYSEFANINGGYEAGVVAALGNVDLYSPVNKEELYLPDVLKMIYSAFDEEVMVYRYKNGEMNYFESEETFAEKWMKLRKIKSVVTDNGITALGGESKVGKGKIKLNEKELNVAEGQNFINLIGRAVEGYYSFDDSKEDVLMACVESDRNKITKINSWDLEKYDSNKIEYFSDDKNKTLKLNENTYLIYNGKNKSSWSEADFKVADGEITVIENGNDYSVVIIEDYINVFVSSYNSEQLKIYNKAKDTVSGNGDDVIDLMKNYEDGVIDISRFNGEKATLDDIKPGIVIDMYKNDDYVKLILTDIVINDFKLLNLNNSDVSEYAFEIESAENKYNVLNRYRSSANAQSLGRNKVYSLYLNRNGVVVWIDSNFVKSDSVAYVIKSYVDEEDERLHLKMLTESGKILTMSCGESVNYTDKTGTKVKLDGNSTFVRIRDYRGIITYKMNAEELITSIEIPREEKTSEEVLQNVKYNNTSSLSYQSDTSYGHFNGEVFLSDDTKIFIIPTEAEDMAIDSNYKVGTRKTVLKTNIRYEPFKAYKYNASSYVAQYIVMEGSVNKDFSYDSASLQFMVVDKISYGMDTDDEECMIVSGWQLGYNVKTNDYITKYARFDKTDLKGNQVSALEVAQDLLSSQNERGEMNTYKIQSGDIIRFTTDESGNFVTGVQILYGIDRINPAFPTGRKGWLVGTTGIYNPDDVNSNPFTVSNYGANAGKPAKIAEASKFMGGGTRFYCGFVYDYVDGIVELTANDFSVNPNFSGEALSTFLTPRIFKTPTVITKNGKNMMVTSGGEASLKTYKDTGNECSRMITVDLDNQFRFYVIINAN